MSSKIRIDDHFNSLRLRHSSLVEYIGNPDSRVMVVCMTPDIEEISPFSGQYSFGVKMAMMELRVPQSFIYLTYLVKQHKSELSVKYWSFQLHKEIEIINPRTIIVLGCQVFNALFDKNESSTAKLRTTHFGSSRWPECSFFVTFDPKEVLSAGGLPSGIGMDWQRDFAAIFDGMESYFPKRILL